jgi:hypothetical protein
LEAEKSIIKNNAGIVPAFYFPGSGTPIIYNHHAGIKKNPVNIDAGEKL